MKLKVNMQQKTVIQMKTETSHNRLSSSINDLVVKTFVCSSIFPIHMALAKDGQYGILEGKSVALIHPIIMFGLFAYTLYK